MLLCVSDIVHFSSLLFSF